MTARTAVAAALTADTDHIVCFSRDGSGRRWQELVSAASRVCARMQRSEAQRWALNLDDAFDFAAALLGCWAARKVPVLAPAVMLGAGTAVSFDAVLEAEGAGTLARERVVWHRLPDTTERIRDIAPSAQLVLYTSGSTGAPKRVERRLHNVESELAVIESLWGASLGAARFFSTVSHRHVYGMLFGLLWPILYRRPFATFVLEYPEQLTDGRGAGQVLVSSPALLKRIGHLVASSDPWQAVFSSGGLLPTEAAADATRLLGVCPVEVLGSTETSGVAWRRQDGAAPPVFTAMPKVETRSGADDFLETRSPFSGQPTWLTMGDRVRFLDVGRFELLGRGDHLAKIEDKRVSLVEIEQCLLETPFIKEAAALALEDRGRQYVGVVAELNSSGVAELARIGRRPFTEGLKAALRPRIERVALPRKFRFVDAIPVDTQGKRTRRTLEILFKGR